MAMSRSLGWTLLTTRSPIEIVPEVMFSSPASMRKRVDLPHPEGPTRTTNSPSSIGIVTPCRTSKPPNDFLTSRICTEDIKSLPDFLNPPRTQVPQASFDWSASYQTFSAMSLDQSRKSSPLHRRDLRSERHDVNIGRNVNAAHAPLKNQACVRCGRNHEQAANRRREAQAPFPGMVQQPS